MTDTQSTTSKTILLVEDDDLVRQLTAEVLEEFGYTVIACRDAASALQQLDSAQPLALLMSDVGLPDMDGRQLAETARQLRPTLPVLFASGHHERELLASQPDGGHVTACASIIKPYDLNQLARQVAELVRDTPAQD
ncbi:response regulator [Pseudomonas sp. NCCP-436]|uniref:response regulator n=1 Tax=Pseudomonas sp. NCCP-436 TaxID=2842481 RepID=UPI001C7F4F83|nr:response regulator [Pseudomonas sp. NCCP-436]